MPLAAPDEAILLPLVSRQMPLAVPQISKPTPLAAPDEAIPLPLVSRQMLLAVSDEVIPPLAQVLSKWVFRHQDDHLGAHVNVS